MLDASHEDHCSRWSGIPQQSLTLFHRQAIGIICRSMRIGPWNVPTNWDRMIVQGDPWPMLKAHIRTSGLATYDFDYLTRLVIGAHDNAIRLEISPSGPGLLCLRMWPRCPGDGDVMSRHPSIEKAIADYRGPPALLPRETPHG
ncbi:hypothetical protein E5S70_07385 [Ensifer adhaerens]|uniref:hypothetical protein n=1 Tax=Ensifer canadensis TaxID=555315 RepID=UPI0014902229|nr:hypothetical protein [Ensifer canadensis]NOV15908.1 hypothetical protein [Ensifer canadensis]